MSRTFGAIDRVRQRHRRSDRGHKRTHYKGKPCKHRKPKFYYRTRRKGSSGTIKIRLFWRVPMSRDGYNNWNSTPWLKAKLYKEVTNMKMSPVIVVNVTEINTKEKIEDYVATKRWAGKFVMMGISYAKTKTHRKWVKICTVVVKETPEGNVGKMIENKRLSKYRWFYKQ